MGMTRNPSAVLAGTPRFELKRAHCFGVCSKMRGDLISRPVRDLDICCPFSTELVVGSPTEVMPTHTAMLHRGLGLRMSVALRARQVVTARPVDDGEASPRSPAQMHHQRSLRRFHKKQTSLETLERLGAN